MDAKRLAGTEEQEAVEATTLTTEEIDEQAEKFTKMLKNLPPRDQVLALDRLAVVLGRPLFEKFPDLKADFDKTRQYLVERAEKEAA